MKKLLVSLLVLAVLVSVAPVALAENRENNNEENHNREEKEKEDKKAKESEVLGYVFQCGEKLPYVRVQATCGSQTLNGSTGSTGGDLGKYSLTFKNKDCKKGSTVTVTANGVTNSGTMGSFLWFKNKAWVDIQTGKDCGGDPQVPEFGALTGVLAAAGSAGSYLLLKKRSA